MKMSEKSKRDLKPENLIEVFDPALEYHNDIPKTFEVSHHQSQDLKRCVYTEGFERLAWAILLCKHVKHTLVNPNKNSFIQ